MIYQEGVPKNISLARGELYHQIPTQECLQVPKYWRLGQVHEEISQNHREGRVSGKPN